MTVLFCELMTIGVMLAFTMAEWISMRGEKEALDKEEKALWYIRAKRVGPARSSIRRILAGGQRASDAVTLGEERYLAGNRLMDDIYIDSSGKRVRLFLNVQKDRVFLTVLRGVVLVCGCAYEADRTKRIEIGDMTKVVLSDIELEFVRKRVM